MDEHIQYLLALTQAKHDYGPMGVADVNILFDTAIKNELDKIINQQTKLTTQETK